ncbi:hypothetical protein FC89_GL000227 [Liquorilactobacillus ghanensis DSM 18630]|uniref:Lipoprotein n=1 Tax=Liquorilactobacillus ghanensis DSM 18630 TaxID=1423750 RepID=A0A0R1VVR6_9LACO|nr:hypothetical protein [Liquorilactobacillus ghanensis]KRM07540.1 hypothetical protein FC89_GL000227 [Liquorilactobacillus ghanensis DSM 18630]
MKRSYGLIAVIITLSLGLSACGNSNSAKQQATISSQKKEISQLKAAASDNGVQTQTSAVVQNKMKGFLKALYENKERNLTKRYNALDPYITGKAEQQLKPKSNDTADNDDGLKLPTITAVKSYIQESQTNADPKQVLTTYTMNYDVNKKQSQSYMVISASLTKENGQWKINKINYNTSINKEGSND